MVGVPWRPRIGLPKIHGNPGERSRGNSCEYCLHDLRRTIVGIGEKVPVDVECDHRVGVAQAPADSQDVDAGGDKVRGVRMAQRVQRHLF